MNNWPSVIADLREHLGVAEIAEAAGVEPSTITELQAGRTKEPRYELGSRILDLHRKYKARKRAAAGA